MLEEPALFHAKLHVLLERRKVFRKPRYPLQESVMKRKILDSKQYRVLRHKTDGTTRPVGPPSQQVIE